MRPIRTQVLRFSTIKYMGIEGFTRQELWYKAWYWIIVFNTQNRVLIAINWTHRNLFAHTYNFFIGRESLIGRVYGNWTCNLVETIILTIFIFGWTLFSPACLIILIFIIFHFTDLLWCLSPDYTFSRLSLWKMPGFFIGICFEFLFFSLIFISVVGVKFQLCASQKIFLVIWKVN